MKSLSKSGNPKKDQGATSASLNKENTSIPQVSTGGEDVYDQQQGVKPVDTSKMVAEKNYYHKPIADVDKRSSTYPSHQPFKSREESGVVSGFVDKERADLKNTSVSSTSHKLYTSSFSHNEVDTEEKVQKVSPPRRKAPRDDKPDKLLRKEGTSFDQSNAPYQQQTTAYTNNVSHGQLETEPPLDGNNNETLEVGYIYGTFL